MKCKMCGAQFDGNFCPKCGTKVDSHSYDYNVSSTGTIVSDDEAIKDPTSFGNRWYWTIALALMGIAGLICGLAIGWWILGILILLGACIMCPKIIAGLPSKVLQAIKIVSVILLATVIIMTYNDVSGRSTGGNNSLQAIVADTEAPNPEWYLTNSDFVTDNNEYIIHVYSNPENPDRLNFSVDYDSFEKVFVCKIDDYEIGTDGSLVYDTEDFFRSSDAVFTYYPDDNHLEFEPDYGECISLDGISQEAADAILAEQQEQSYTPQEYYVGDVLSSENYNAFTRYAYTDVTMMGDIAVHVLCDIVVPSSSETITFDSADFMLNNNGIIKYGNSEYDYTTLAGGANIVVDISFTYPSNSNYNLDNMVMTLGSTDMLLSPKPQSGYDYDAIYGTYYSEKSNSDRYVIEWLGGNKYNCVLIAQDGARLSVKRSFTFTCDSTTRCTIDEGEYLSYEWISSDHAFVCHCNDLGYPTTTYYYK